MSPEIIASIVAVGSLATAAAGWFDAKKKAVLAENKAKEAEEKTEKIEVARKESKICRDDEIHKLKTRMALVEKDCKFVYVLADKVDKMNETLIEIKVLAERYFVKKEG